MSILRTCADGPADCAPAVAEPGARPRKVVDRVRLVFDHLALWRERARQRRQLLTLDARALADIGLGRAEAEAEADKPFWRP